MFLRSSRASKTRDGVRTTTAAFRSSTFEVQEPQVWALGPNAAAISFGLRELMVDTAGVTMDVHAVLTLVWSRRADGWRIILAHESIAPSD